MPGSCLSASIGVHLRLNDFSLPAAPHEELAQGWVGANRLRDRSAEYRYGQDLILSGLIAWPLIIVYARARLTRAAQQRWIVLIHSSAGSGGGHPERSAGGSAVIRA